MKFYFQLQYRRIQRMLTAFGLPPFLGYILMAIIFVGLSVFLFVKTEYATWIYIGFALSTLFQLGEQGRASQLKSIFKQTDYYKIRLIENAIVALPFLFFLFYEGAFLEALGLIILSPLLVFFNSKISFNRTIPTPFKKIPFEFIIGFRKTVLLILIGCFILIKAVQVENFNLGLGVLVSLFLLSMSYYSKPEPVFFVWIFNLKRIPFLRKKVTDAIICSTILTMPVLIVLIVFFTENWLFILDVQFLGYIFLTSMVFAKYSAFPRVISVPQAVLYGLSLWFPPMLLLIIPIFYIQSKRNLKPILE